MIKRFLDYTGFTQTATVSREQRFARSVLKKEAKIGGQLFGAVPKGVNRQFFCLDEYTWIWYEQWIENRQQYSRTTKYIIRPTGIVKAQDGQDYRLVSRKEANRLLAAAKSYQAQVDKKVYQPLLNSL